MRNLFYPKRNSHKGENGKLLVIGGSNLFHAAAFFAADVASRIVDLVYFSSAAEENNDLMRVKAKEKFWNGIVVSWNNVEEYIEEADCILIGPGMPRKEGLMKGELATEEVVNRLVTKYNSKRWVIDGGALQEIDVKLLNEHMVITPHQGEWERLTKRKGKSTDEVKLFSKTYGCTVLLKGVEDVVCKAERCKVVKGGNAGMTKGGTGDVLAGIVAGLHCKNDAFLAAVYASKINKQAGDELYEKVGVNFNASDLVVAVAEVMK